MRILPFRRLRRFSRFNEPWSLPERMLAAMIVAIAGVMVVVGFAQSPIAALRPGTQPGSFHCRFIHVVDGDTLRCGAQRVRLEGIDAPELPGHCRPGRRCVTGDPFASAENLRTLISAGPVVCKPITTDRYGRTVARCSAGGVDLSCGQLRKGHAIRRYGMIFC